MEEIKEEDEDEDEDEESRFSGIETIKEADEKNDDEKALPLLQKHESSINLDTIDKEREELMFESESRRVLKNDDEDFMRWIDEFKDEIMKVARFYILKLNEN